MPLPCIHTDWLTNEGRDSRASQQANDEARRKVKNKLEEGIIESYLQPSGTM